MNVLKEVVLRILNIIDNNRIFSLNAQVPKSVMAQVLTTTVLPRKKTFKHLKTPDTDDDESAPCDGPTSGRHLTSVVFGKNSIRFLPQFPSTLKPLKTAIQLPKKIGSHYVLKANSLSRFRVGGYIGKSTLPPRIFNIVLCHRF